MPKVVIELQANTQDAVNKIQQFARAQKDAFDAVKAGNPALEDAYVKVSKLVESNGAAAKSTADFNRAAKDLAKGGVRELINDIPILGGTLSKLAGTLGGFPLLIGGIVGAGVGLLKFLDDMSTKATKALDDITALGKGLEQNLQTTILEVQQIRAGAAGNQAGVLERGAELARKRAEQASEDAIAAAAKKAQSEVPGVLSLEGFADVITSGGKLGADEKHAAEVAEKIAAARRAAEGKLATDVFKINEKLKADLKALEDDYDKKLADSQDKRVKDAADSADKQKKIIEDLKSSTLSTFKGLGEEFADVTKKLEVQKFVEDTQKQIDELKKAMEAGLDTEGKFGAAIEALTRKQQDAIANGYVPTVAAAKKVTEAVTVAAEATKAASDSIAEGLFRVGAASASVISTLDAVIKKGQEAMAAFAAQGKAGPIPIAGTGGFSMAGGAGSAVRPEAGGAAAPFVLPGFRHVGGGSGTVLGGIVNQPTGSDIFAASRPSQYDLGGFSHPSIRDTGVLNPNPASAAGYLPPPAPIQTVNLTVNQTGTVVSNDRDWATVTAGISQALR